MRIGLIAIAAFALTACGGEKAPHPYPPAAEAHFFSACPADSAVCVCTWDAIKREVTHEEYEAALARFRETGLMEPRITRARTKCIEQNREG